jgi:hypothetical protein
LLGAPAVLATSLFPQFTQKRTSDSFFDPHFSQFFMATYFI